MQGFVDDPSSGNLLTALESNMTASQSTYGRENGCILQSTPENLGTLLEQYGLQSTGEPPGMAADLVVKEDIEKYDIKVES